MPEATPAGILKVNVRQTAGHPWKVFPVDGNGNAYSHSQVLRWVQAATDRTNA